MQAQSNLSGIGIVQPSGFQFSQQGAQHITHIQPTAGVTNPYEKYAIQFQLPNAMLWQIKFILSSVNSKKSIVTASNEFQALSEQFGKDFDKFLLNELMDQIELKDASKANKDKSESVKITLLNQELTRASVKPEFLSYFGEILQNIYGQDAKSKAQEFIQELTKRLKLNCQTQILIALSILESSGDEQIQADIIKYLKLKLAEFYQNGKPDQFPEYAIHRILFLMDTIPEFMNDTQLQGPKQFLIETNANKFSQFTPLRSSLFQDISHINCHPELPSFNLMKDGCGLEHLEFASKILKPWEVLVDIGHSSTYNYDFLIKTLSEFKQIEEKDMALMLLNLAINNEGKDDHISKIVFNTFESNKDGNGNSIKKEPEDKKTTMSWSADNLQRAFRELYSYLNWPSVFESFAEIDEWELPTEFLDYGFGQVQFKCLLHLINKVKPQNCAFPLNTLMTKSWKSSFLQITLIDHCIIEYGVKKESLKILQFKTLKNKVASIQELNELERKFSKEHVEVWQSVDMVERLIILSENPGFFPKVRKIFDWPIANIPEYLLLSVSLAKPNCGNLMLDELLSVLLPLFLGNHDNSPIVLQNLFSMNQDLFIRGICELCKHDQKLMNLSRVLDITQEIKDSLIKIVYCEDYNFAVNLGVLAGKRDFLHYDVWIKSRIKDVGTPFINALIKYIQDNIIAPVSEFVMQNQTLAESSPENFEQQKSQILERSHLSKEKLILTIDHLQNNQLRQNDKITRETLQKIQELVVKNQELFPQHYEPGQNSEEIEAAANEHFQRVFSAEEADVDSRIEELIVTMQNFKDSQIVKEQEIYACMLHGLFDEYRFLHRYPPQYLTKIAKLFGAIIKNNLLDRVLQNIALKFVFEAFRRDNRRQKFGIIVIKSFFDMLPKFPKFLEDIYQIRQIIQHSEPKMMVEIEQLYNQMISQQNFNQQPQNPAPPVAEVNSHLNIDAISEQLKAEQQEFKDEMAKQQPFDPKKDDKKDKKAQVKGKEQQNMATQKQFVKNQKGSQGSPQNSLKQTITTPIGSKEFIPTNRNMPPGFIPISTSPNMAQSKVFIPSKTKGTDDLQNIEASNLIDHVNIGNSGSQQQTFNMSKNQSVAPIIAGVTPVGPGGGSLNVRSAEFQRPMSNPNILPTEKTSKQININSKEFMPSRQDASPQKKVVQQSQIKDLLSYKQNIAEKISTCISNGTRLRLDDLLEDSTIKVEDEYVEDQIRIICNNTGKGNFKQKIEDLKKFVVRKQPEFGKDGKEIVDANSNNAQDHLRWFIQYILIKRLGPSSVSLQGIYVEMIRELNSSIMAISNKTNVIQQTLWQVSFIFKKCMLIDEDEFDKVISAQQQGSTLLKNYVASLGSFVGNLTLSKNEPIRCNHLDLKQILIEGFQVKNKRLAIIFVCRILKESQVSRVFNLRNPWVMTLLQILREILAFSSMMVGGMGQNDYNMEIESLFKTLNAQNIAEIKPHGILESLQKSGNLVQPHIKKELEFMHKKVKVILPASADLSNSGEGSKDVSLNTGAVSSEQELLRQQMSQIQQRVSVSNELIYFFQRFTNFNERKLRKLVGNAVDNSIVEILPPVVDRSVTIALITTRELVLKDFAFDGDHVKVINAADLIVQNLAGSLALVTCREPLRMSLNTNLKKVFENHFKNDLGVEITKGSKTGNVDNGEYGFEPEKLTFDKDTPKGNINQVSEDKIIDIANISSRENLELGCMLIKKKVIEKALRKVREDIQISQAIDKRQRSQELGIKFFRDENIVSQFQELPLKLQPNPNGLTESQFKVYEDFQKLNQPVQEFEGEDLLFGLESELQSQDLTSNLEGSIDDLQKNQPANLASILKLIDQNGLNDMHQSLLVQKLHAMNENIDEENEMLWTYVQRNFENACKNYDSRNPQAVQNIIQILSLIVKNYKVENFSIRLLNKVFLLLDVRIFNDLELNILLMSKGIISISEWDRQIANYFKEEAAELPESELQFFANILEIAIVERKIFTSEEVPQLIAVIKSMANDRKIGKFCQYILKNLSNIKTESGESIFSDQKNENLKEFFLKWVEISYVDDKESQEKQINNLFLELRGMGIDQDPQLLFQLCKVMVKTSIERALYFGEDASNRRPNDRLDFRYIDSFVKLIVVLLTMFSFNKHEFMTKIFEFIEEKIDIDHKVNQTNFNQRPYYRMLMNILTAVNHQYCFNTKTQQQILTSLADLFKQLNPQKYPAFSFAWLELVSHKHFMPHFLKQPVQGQFNMQQLSQGNFQQNLPGFQNLGHQNPNMMMMQENNFLQRRFKMKDLVVLMLTFLKANMISAVPMPPVIQAYYHAVLRIFNVILLDYPEFLSEFHFNFVNSLPDNCVQIRNLILYAHPKSITHHDPFSKNLKIDKLVEIKNKPRNLSNFENYLQLMNLKDDLDTLMRTNNHHPVLQEICYKMEQSEEIINGRRRTSSNVISAVILYIANKACQIEHRDTFKKMAHRLNDQTRLSFLNSIVDELRFPNSHSFYFSCIILFIYLEAGKDIIHEQISRIFLERLQCVGPYPWGLMISFRELIQNPKYKFMEKKYIRESPAAIQNLFMTRLRNFYDIAPHILQGLPTKA